MIEASAAVLATLLFLVPAPDADTWCDPGEQPGEVAAAPRASRGLVHPMGSVRPYGVRGGEPASDEELRALYRSGVSYRRFLDEARRRVELWQANTATAAEIDPSLVERARAVGGAWHVLAVAIDSCSDSVSTLPWVAALAERVEGLELRVVDPSAGRSVMEGHPTPDGRAATPTMLLLDAGYDEVGCFIERPPGLQRWIAERPELSPQEVYEGKMAWYDEDGGEDTVRAFVEMMEAAADGRRICR